MPAPSVFMLCDVLRLQARTADEVGEEEGGCHRVHHLREPLALEVRLRVVRLGCRHITKKKMGIFISTVDTVRGEAANN